MMWASGLFGEAKTRICRLFAWPALYPDVYDDMLNT
jgi:hypothetical protein